MRNLLFFVSAAISFSVALSGCLVQVEAVGGNDTMNGRINEPCQDGGCCQRKIAQRARRLDGSWAGENASLVVRNLPVACAGYDCTGNPQTQIRLGCDSGTIESDILLISDSCDGNVETFSAIAGLSTASGHQVANIEGRVFQDSQMELRVSYSEGNVRRLESYKLSRVKEVDFGGMRTKCPISEELIITEADLGREIQVTMGQTFTIRVANSTVVSYDGNLLKEELVPWIAATSAGAATAGGAVSAPIGDPMIPNPPVFLGDHRFTGIADGLAEVSLQVGFGGGCEAPSGVICPMIMAPVRLETFKIRVRGAMAL